MFYDFIPCHHCKNYDKDRAWCNLFLMRKVDGCPCGEEKKEEENEGNNSRKNGEN